MDLEAVRGNAFLHPDQRSGISSHIPQKRGKEFHPAPASDSIYFPNRILELITKNVPELNSFGMESGSFAWKHGSVLLRTGFQAIFIHADRDEQQHYYC